MDVVYTETIGDEDYAVDAVVVRDWKTAWPTDASELETIQRKGQAVLAWVNHPEAEAIKLEVTNIRTGMTYDKVIYKNDEGLALLELWKRDILQACDAMDLTREFRPGAGCLSCKYPLSCDSCLEYAKTGTAHTATALATLEAMRSEFIRVLKPMCEFENIPIDGGYIGFKQMDKRIPTKEAHRYLVNHWYGNDIDPHTEEKSLMFSASMGVTQVESIIKTMYPDKRDLSREELTDQCIEVKKQARFGVHKL
jgi:hypothetical protein